VVGVCVHFEGSSNFTVLQNFVTVGIASTAEGTL
jgi:hypothetical protein